MPSVGRILDANANRAREALRVMEEAARFILDDDPLVRDLKTLRHDLRECLDDLPTSVNPPVSWRDTPGDVGTNVATDAEGRRDTAADVAIAAGKRLSEALRAIEEYIKVLAGSGSADLAPRFESLRYRGYELERRLDLALGTGRRRQWQLCVLLTAELCRPGHDWFHVAEQAVMGGADCLQLREKNLEGRELLARARRLVGLCRPRGVSVIINDRPDIALLAGADGVHVGQGDLPVAEVRKLVGRQLLVGVSTFNLAEAEQGLREGADYCGVGPMFPTTTKRKDVLAGPAALRAYVAWGKLPHLAIGGITPQNMGELMMAGGRGVAVSACVVAAADPAAACRALLAGLSDRREIRTSPDAVSPQRG